MWWLWAGVLREGKLGEEKVLGRLLRNDTWAFTGCCWLRHQGQMKCWTSMPGGVESGETGVAKEDGSYRPHEETAARKLCATAELMCCQASCTLRQGSVKKDCRLDLCGPQLTFALIQWAHAQSEGTESWRVGWVISCCLKAHSGGNKLRWWVRSVWIRIGQI